MEYANSVTFLFRLKFGKSYMDGVCPGPVEHFLDPMLNIQNLPNLSTLIVYSHSHMLKKRGRKEEKKSTCLRF